MRQSVRLSASPVVRLSTLLSVRLSNCPSVQLFTRLSVSPVSCIAIIINQLNKPAADSYANAMQTHTHSPTHIHTHIHMHIYTHKALAARYARDVSLRSKHLTLFANIRRQAFKLIMSPSQASFA